MTSSPELVYLDLSAEAHNTKATTSPAIPASPAAPADDLPPTATAAFVLLDGSADAVSVAEGEALAVDETVSVSVSFTAEAHTVNY